MNESPYSFDATIDNFQEQVLQASMQTPVLVDVWADWCEPCKTLMPMLEKLTDEYRGNVLLARVNAEEQQELAGHLGVRSLPTVLLVKEGQAVDGFNGALSEGEIRKVLEKHVTAPAEDPYEKAHRLWEQGDKEDALAVLTEMNQQDSGNLDVLIDLAQLKAELGDLDTAQQVLDSLATEDRMQHKAKQLEARLKFLRQAGELPPVDELDRRLEADPKDAEALHKRALHHTLAEENDDAMALLIRLMQVAPEYEDGVAKTTLVELFEKLGNSDPNVRTYRRKLYTLMH